MIEFDEVKQAAAQAIDENFVCFAEDFSRNLQRQLDRVETQQRHLKEYVENHLDPVIIEIRDLLRAKGNEHGTH
jgi:hypothetical protein